jgi:hypothetical protein
MIDNSTIISILTSLFSGLIGAILVFILVMRRENQKQIRKQKLVSVAFLMEINKYQSFFQTITTGFNSQDFQDNDNYKSRVFKTIVDYPAITSTGNNSGMIKNNSPFIEFHKEIFEFDDESVIAELDRYCDHVFLADKYFKNLCDVDNRIGTDFIHFLENIERGYSLMRGGNSIPYLLKKSQIESKTLRQRIQNFFNNT